MSNCFEIYQRKFREVVLDAIEKCHSFAASDSTSDQKQKLISEIKIGIEHAEILFAQMEGEFKHLEPEVMVEIIDGPWQTYKDDIQSLKMEFERFTLELPSADQREKMKSCMEKINQAGERIAERRTTTPEIVELGVSVLQDLHEQRETLLTSHERSLPEVDDDAIDIYMMAGSLCQYFVGAVIGILILASILIICLKS